MSLGLVIVSATWPDAVRKLAASFLRNPVRVTVGSDDLTANSRVEQGMLHFFSRESYQVTHTSSLFLVVEVFDDARSKE